MKLDFKRTIKIGFAFLGIMLFWEMYDFAIPLILDRTFGLNASARGLIMGLDNILALFLLPLFGAISDKHNTKLGRRTPFILIGTICAIVLTVVLAVVQNVQMNALIAKGVTDEAALIEGGYFTAEELALLPTLAKDSAQYATILHNAQTAMASAAVKSSPASLIIFIAVLFFLLLAMSVYRSPAVALMPDVTPKPLRSTANAVINAMGGVGGLLAIIIYTVLKPGYGNFTAMFATTAVAMLVILIIYLALVREPKFVELRLEQERAAEYIDVEEKIETGKMPRAKFISFLLILTSIFFWFMGFNAIKSHLSTYAVNNLHFTTSQVGMINIANTVGGAIALVPVAFMAKGLGRKKTVLIGLALAIGVCIPLAFITPATKWWFAVCFVIAGFGLISINVNTFPMVTELSKGANTGRYTGIYYACTMSAQAITPFLAGLCIDHISPRSLFVYSIGMLLISIIAMALVRHGDAKADKNSKIADFIDID